MAQLFWVIAAGCTLTIAALPSRSAELKEEPLATRSGPRGATLFTSLPSEQTGLVANNAYDDPTMWGDRYQEFVYGAIGTGVAIGDFDNDGRPDILVATKTGGCRLFRNLGGWKFEDVTVKAGLGANSAGWMDQAKGWFGLGHSDGGGGRIWYQGVTFADVNNDGRLDIYICRFNAPNLLYINQGDGTFREEAEKRGVAISDASGMAAFCDYDRDGALDFYLQTNLLDAQGHPVGQRDYLFHNHGDGTFENVTDRAGIAGETQGHSATWWDFDGDGWPDLYVANDFAVPDSLYRNNHDGTFTQVTDRAVPHMPHSAMGADLGDLNNDGRIDLLVADMAATSHEKDQRGMAKIRTMLNDARDSDSAAPQYMQSALYLNTGTSHVLEAARMAGLAATDWTWSVCLHDLDNDGRIDAFFTNGMVRELHNADLSQRLSEVESPADRIRVMKDSPLFAETHLAFRNLGDLKFENVSAAWGLDQKAVSFGAAFGDLDGDGDLDLVYTNFDGGLTVLRNDSDTGHRAIFVLRGTHSNRFGIGATVEIQTVSGKQIRQLVLARGYLSANEPVLHFGLGEDDHIIRTTVTWPSGAVQSFDGLAADRKYTIEEPANAAVSRDPPHTANQTLYQDVSDSVNFSFLQKSHAVPLGSLQPLLTLRPDWRDPALSVDDAGSGLNVIVGATGDTGRHDLRLSQAGRFVENDAGLPHDSKLPDGPLLIFDASGQGRGDVLVTRGGSKFPANSPEYQPKLFLRDASGRLAPAADDALPRLPWSVGAAAVADFDRDGHLDLFLGARWIPGKYPLAAGAAILGNDNGKFVDVTETVAPQLHELGLVTSAIWSDVDGDGWPDLLVTLDWGTVKYFHNAAGRRFEDWSDRAGFSRAGNGWWTAIAAGDFNGDGRPDFVVGNVGLNTPYHATFEHPAEIYYGNFGAATPLLLEGYFEGERLYPWRTRGELGARIPSILKRFPRNDDYARATLADIVGPDQLSAARKFTANEFQSGVFLSQPDGTYTFQPLPRLAQIAPLQGIAVGDFDDDGNLDIYALQNSYAPIPSVGHFDGGLSQLLHGDGHGHFTVVELPQSGLVVPGDAKALAVADLNHDGWPDFLATRHDGTTLAFQHRTNAARQPLAVRLRGEPGNSTGIGARVSVEFSDGSRQAGEVSCGGGFNSQSSATLFFSFAPSNPAKQIEVRWPGGATNVTPLAGAALPYVEISQPAR